MTRSDSPLSRVHAVLDQLQAAPVATAYSPLSLMPTVPEHPPTDCPIASL